MSISRSDKVRPGAPDNLHLPAPESDPGALPRRCGRWPGLRLTLLPEWLHPAADTRGLYPAAPIYG